MPTKTTKKTSVKKGSSTSSLASSKKATAPKSSKIEKKDSTKKVVVKRRKLDLTPTRASAVAIASQANREKKQALIDKLASEDRVFKREDSSNKIPLWVWVFFWCALLLFCISFYQAIIRPQLEEELTQANADEAYVSEWDSISLWWSDVSDSENYVNEQNIEENKIQTPSTAVETIEEFFRRLSNREFDEAYNLLTPSMQRSSEIREHFTSFRMNPFVSGLQGELKPTNFRYISTSTYWKDKYGFDLSYTLATNQETYNEEWEFIVDTSWDEPKIARVVCVTSKCSFHPIFWPENYGLMR